MYFNEKCFQISNLTVCNLTAKPEHDKVFICSFGGYYDCSEFLRSASSEWFYIFER